jgi:hypothetical protein
MASKVKLELTPQQARYVGETYDVKADLARVVGHRNDATTYENIAAEAHAAADRGFAS